MNIQEMNIMNAIKKEGFGNQRMLSEHTGLSLGKVNQSLRELQEQGYLNGQMGLTALAEEVFAEHQPKNAIILAAGYGMRMVPINTEISKGMLEVHGEILIERIIRQLQEAGICDISVVVGFMKEEYEYLIDKYQVKLVVNREYAAKNNLHSLALISGKIENTYIVPCDIWCGANPFSCRELYSWYMVTELVDDESTVRVNRKQELVKAVGGGNQMIGIAYISKADSKAVQKRLEELDGNKNYKDCFWEEVLFEKDRMLAAARMASSVNTYEINTFEQLKELDADSSQLKTEVITLIASVLKVPEDEVTDITVLKKGMTNRSFRFTCQGKQYIMRIPGEGTEQLLNRQQEYQVYSAIRELDLCDDIYYIDPENGYKMTAFLEGARVCDPENMEDVRRCMECLRGFHGLGLTVGHSFDIFGQMEFYESLWGQKASCYRDYRTTKSKIYELKEYIDRQPKDWVLTHIDAVPDNFMFVPEVFGERICMIDWEYAGMQDPHVDIAMFCIYALYEREQVEQLIQLYFPESCPKQVRVKIYCYIAVCGLLWSNWCEYKRGLGVEFGEYSLRQYRYAKDYYKIAKEEMERLREDVSGKKSYYYGSRNGNKNAAGNIKDTKAAGACERSADD